MAVRVIASRVAMALDGLWLVAVGTRPLSYFGTKTEQFTVIQADEMDELHEAMLARPTTVLL